MAPGVERAQGETDRHAGLKRLAFLWAQAHTYSACAMEVNLSKCRYRADVAAYRPEPENSGSTAIFECKQALCDLRRDNCQSDAARQRLETICERRQLLESRLCAHYPNLRNGDSLFPEFDSRNFTALGHRGYSRVLRELNALKSGEKGEKVDCNIAESIAPLRSGTHLLISGGLSGEARHSIG